MSSCLYTVTLQPNDKKKEQRWKNIIPKKVTEIPVLGVEHFWLSEHELVYHFYDPFPSHNGTNRKIMSFLLPLDCHSTCTPDGEVFHGPATFPGKRKTHLNPLAPVNVSWVSGLSRQDTRGGIRDIPGHGKSKQETCGGVCDMPGKRETSQGKHGESKLYSKTRNITLRQAEVHWHTPERTSSRQTTLQTHQCVLSQQRT